MCGIEGKLWIRNFKVEWVRGKYGVGILKDLDFCGDGDGENVLRLEGKNKVKVGG